MVGACAWSEEDTWSWYLDVRTQLDREVIHALVGDVFRFADYAGLPLDMVVNKPNETARIGIRVAPLQTC